MEMKLQTNCSEWSEGLDTEGLDDYYDDEWQDTEQDQPTDIESGGGKALEAFKNKPKVEVTCITSTITKLHKKRKGWKVRQYKWNTKQAIINYNNILLYGRCK